MGCDRRGLRLLEQRSSDRVSGDQQHPGRLGHRGERPDDGFRQHGREQRHGRGVHARSRGRRKRILRRVPDERPGRGRGGRDPHAAADQHPSEEDNGCGVDVARRGDAGDLHAVGEDPGHAGQALSGDAGRRVHDPEGPSLDAPDARGQAYRSGGDADRGGDGTGGSDLEGGGADARGAGAAQSAAPPCVRPGGEAGC